MTKFFNIFRLFHIFCLSVVLIASSAQAKKNKPHDQSPKKSKIAKKGNHKNSNAINVVVGDFIGPGSTQFHDAAKSAIGKQNDFRIVSQEELDTAQAKTTLQMRSAEDYKSVAQELNAAAFVTGESSRKGRKWIAAVRVRNGADGQMLGAASFSGNTMNDVRSQIEENLWSRLGNSVASSSAPRNDEPQVRKDEKPLPAEPTSKKGKPSNTTVITIPTATGKKRSNASATLDSPEAVENEPAESSLKDKSFAEEKELPPGLAGKEEERPASTETSNSPPTPKRILLDSQLALGLFGRQFTYKDDIFRKLSPYKVGPWPSWGFNLTLYPAALFGSAPIGVQRIGLTGSFQQGIGIKSSDTTGTIRYPTSYTAYSGGLKYLIPFSVLEIEPQVGLVRSRYSILAASVTNPRPEIPYAFYLAAYLGMGIRVNIAEKLAVKVHGAYLPIISKGEIATAAFFPRTAAGGIEAGFYVAYDLYHGLEARVGADYQRFFFTFDPQPGDAKVAGGALDQYYNIYLALGWRFFLGG